MRRIYLRNIKKYALVDDEDYERINQRNWSGWRTKEHKTFYARHPSKGGLKYLRMHKEVLDKKIPKGHSIDHINRNGLDNRKCNLRIVTHSINNLNRGTPKNNTTGVKNITICGGRFRVRLTAREGRISIGKYTTLKEAKKVLRKFLKENPIV